MEIAIYVGMLLIGLVAMWIIHKLAVHDTNKSGP
jgi:hypothetical protein